MAKNGQVPPETVSMIVDRLTSRFNLFSPPGELTLHEMEELIHLHRQSLDGPWANADIFRRTGEALSQPFLHSRIRKVAAIESQGVLLAAAVADRLKAGLIIIHKPGYLDHKDRTPNYPILTETLTDYSHQPKTLILENNPDTVESNDRILVVDDWFATGNHAQAVIKLFRRLHRGKLVGFSFVFNSLSAEAEARLKQSYQIHSLIPYQPPSTP